MREWIKAIIIILLLAFGSFGIYTLNSNSHEPHPQVINITNITYTQSIAEKHNASATLFYHTFSLSGSNATYGFSLNNTDPYSFDVVNGLLIYITKVAQSMNSPYHATFLLQFNSGNASVEFNNRTYPSVNTNSGGGNPTKSLNVFEYGIDYRSPIQFCSIPNPYCSNASGYHITSYNLTYYLEVTPIVEFGPSYTIGKPVLISHTFTYPFTGS